MIAVGDKELSSVPASDKEKRGKFLPGDNPFLILLHV